MDEKTHTTTKSVYFKNLLTIGAADLLVGLLISVIDGYMLAADR